MKHGSLFSGIGGFDLASQWMGWENVFQVEWDKYCQKVLAKNFPNVKRYGDIKEFDGTKYRGLIDIISGGFPCQPFSVAGKRQGKTDDRFLWPEMLRIIAEIKPPFIVGENVGGLVSMENGKILDKILSDLADEGYQTEQYIIPACAVGAWHRRDRIWIIAHSGCKSFKQNIERGRGKHISERNEVGEVITTISKCGNDTNSDSDRLQRDFAKSQTQRDINEFITPKVWKDYSFESPICRTIDGIPHRMDRIKGLGNAIVPQVAYQIFKAIEQYNNNILS